MQNNIIVPVYSSLKLQHLGGYIRIAFKIKQSQNNNNIGFPGRFRKMCTLLCKTCIQFGQRPRLVCISPLAAII